MSQGFYQISLCVAMQSHNSSGSQGPAEIVLAWAAVTWRWGRAERLGRAKLWLLPVCLCVCWWGDGLRGDSCLELCWLRAPANARHGLQMLARVPDTLQSADSVLGQGASNSVPMVSKSGVSISHSPAVLQIINPLGLKGGWASGGMGLLLPVLHQGWGI